MGHSVGTKKTGGRKKGSLNKSTLERKEFLASGGVSPLDYMLSVLRDEDAPADKRFLAAKECAPYCHPRLASTEHKGEGGGPIRHAVALTDEMRARALLMFAEKTGFMLVKKD